MLTGFRLGAALRPHGIRPLTQFSLTRLASAGGALSRVGTLPALHPTVERPPLTSVVRFGGSLRSPALRSHRVRSILALASLLLGHWLRHPQHWFDVANRGVVHPPPRPIQTASEPGGEKTQLDNPVTPQGMRHRSLPSGATHRVARYEWARYGEGFAGELALPNGTKQPAQGFYYRLRRQVERPA